MPGRVEKKQDDGVDDADDDGRRRQQIEVDCLSIRSKWNEEDATKENSSNSRNKKKRKEKKNKHTQTHDKEETENLFERKLFHNCCYLKIAKRRLCKIQGIASL